MRLSGATLADNYVLNAYFYLATTTETSFTISSQVIGEEIMGLEWGLRTF